MTPLRAAALGLFLSFGCAAQQRSIAYESAKVARELADEGALAWEWAVNDQVALCQKTVPQESSTPEQRAQCLGVFNETDKALAVFEAIVSAQQAVYWALKFGELKDVRSALAQLDDVLADVRPYLDAVRKVKR